MFLKSLSIINNGESSVIREIKFHKGVNLILDETSSADKTESGNNVGKTTVFRLIDFACAAMEKTSIQIRSLATPM